MAYVRTRGYKQWRKQQHEQLPNTEIRKRLKTKAANADEWVRAVWALCRCAQTRLRSIGGSLGSHTAVCCFWIDHVPSLAMLLMLLAHCAY